MRYDCRERVELTNFAIFVFEILIAKATAMKIRSGHYYDFDGEPQVGNWRISFRDGDFCRIETSIDGIEGYKVIAIPAEPIFGYRRVSPVTLKIDGKAFDLGTQSTPNYSWPLASRYGVRLYFDGNAVKVELEFNSAEAEPLQFIHVALLDDLEPVASPQRMQKFIADDSKEMALPVAEKTDTKDFRQGITSDGKAGRFGFVKGDGLLDCAMPYLGVVDKMYLCGTPAYQKPFRWTCRLLPPHMPLHGEFQVATVKPDCDKIEVNRLSVFWEAKNGDNTFSCRYSIASPGIVVRDSRKEIRISDLEYAGNYQYVLIPKTGGAQIHTLETIEQLDMAANYLLFFGSTEYPDVPLLVVLTRPPEALKVSRDARTQRLTEISFPGIDTAIVATPFGIESFAPLSPLDEAFLSEALRRCQFWSRALLAMPVAVKEFYQLDLKSSRVTIVEKFDYEYFSDAWGTLPLEIAPLPPVLGHCGTARHAGVKLGFPTKYGELTAVAGKEAVYTIPLADSMRRFPLRDAKDKSVDTLIADGFDEYLSFTEKFDDGTQSYPYAGSLLEPFAMASTMLNFMPREGKERLTAKLAERLRLVNEVDRSYNYPVIDFSKMMKLMPDDEKVLEIYRDPDLPRKKLWNYYERTERYTKTSYFICYLNLCLFNVEKVLKTGTREEISSVVFPLVENDWGAGLTFYYMYLAMLATGSTQEIKANWLNIKKMNRFFEAFHDWACMASGYAENALGWVEGANYGAFTVFPRLAHAVGDDEAESFARYLGAKQLALRASQLRGGVDYFNHYMHTEPWYFWKFYRSESNPAFEFMSLPELWENGTVNGALYNCTTEGIYPEYFTDMRKVLPEDFDRTIQLYRAELMKFDKAKIWMTIQQLSSVLLSEALNENIPEEKVLADLKAAEANGLLFHEWRGIHIFSRRLPKNYFESQIRAFLLSRKHPIYLLNWENVKVIDAVWDSDQSMARIDLEKIGADRGELTLMLKKQAREIRVAGMPYPIPAVGKATIKVSGSTTVEIVF